MPLDTSKFIASVMYNRMAIPLQAIGVSGSKAEPAKWDGAYDDVMGVTAIGKGK